MLDEYVTQAHRYLWFERIDLEVSLRNRYHRCKNVRLSFAILHNAEVGYIDRALVVGTPR